MENKENSVDIFGAYLICSKFVKRYWYVLLLSVLIGGGIGAFSAHKNGNRFVNSIVVYSNAIEKGQLYAQLFPILQSERNGISSTMLTNFFDVEKDVFKDVCSMMPDTITSSNAILFKFVTKDSACLTQILGVFTDFYDNQDVINENFASAQKSNKLLLQQLNEEIEQINTYQENILKNSKSENSSGFSPSITGSHEELMILYEKKMELEAQLLQTSPVMVYSAHKTMIDYQNYTRNVILWALLISLITGMFLIIIDLERASRKHN